MWQGRCLQDKFELSDPVYEGEHGGQYLATAIDNGTNLLATVYTARQVNDECLSAFQAAVESFKAIGASPVEAQLQLDDGFVVLEPRPSGQPLSKLLSERGALDPPLALNVASQTLRELARFHGAGLDVHTVSTHSIWVDLSDGQVRCAITQLGQRELFAFDAAKSRADGVCYALPSYLSPEAVSGRQLNSQTDVYSVGLLLYEMLAGRPAFQGEDFKKVARQTCPRASIKSTDCQSCCKAFV